MNDIEIDEKLYNNISVYYTGYVAIYSKTNSVNPLHLVFNKVNGYVITKCGTVVEHFIDFKAITR